MAYLSKLIERCVLILSNIRQLMERSGVTYRDLEALSGLSLGTIHKARNDGEGKIESCTLATLAQIARALGVQVKDLFEEK